MTSLHETLRSAWESDSDRMFLRPPGAEPWTYGALDLLAADLAGVLSRHGAGPGQRVIVQVDKTPEAVAVYLACVRLGAVYVPLNPAYTVAEVEYFVSDADPVVLVARDDSVQSILPSATALLTLDAAGRGTLIDVIALGSRPAAPTPGDGSDVVAMLYTSGTTGRSKGAMLTSDNLVSNAVSLHRIWGWVDGDVLLHGLPIFHTHGLFVALHCAMLGTSEVIFLDRFTVESARQLLPRATVMMGVPTYYHRLLADGGFGAEDARGMRLFTSGSAPLSEAAHRAFEARTGHAILERYGMTEAGMITSNPYAGPRIAGTVGYALPDVDVRVVDDAGAAVRAGTSGTVEVRGPNVFSGYWGLAAKTKAEFRADGFFRTGDIGTLSDDGRLTLAGRSSDVIISGGLNVYPKEIELVLDAVGGVAESAVVGVPHPDFGEAVVAVVVGGSDESALRAACDRQLAAFKRPKAYCMVDELPRNAMGKVQKNELRDSYADLFT